MKIIYRPIYANVDARLISLVEECMSAKLSFIREIQG